MLILGLLRFVVLSLNKMCVVVMSEFIYLQGSVVADKNCAKIHYMAKNI